jgi:glycosyltransferase involved in cell wall biosynthesis
VEVGLPAKDEATEVAACMDVSVIVPTRNRRNLLAKTLRSALQQQGVVSEVIVVDDASTDDTPAFLTGLTDAGVRVIRHDSSRGLSAARNHGASEARGEWVEFLDDDDLWAPDKLRRQIGAAREAAREWAYTGAVNIDGNRIVLGRPPLPPEQAVTALFRYNAIPGGGSNVIVRRSTWLRVGPFEPRFPNVGEDW